MTAKWPSQREEVMANTENHIYTGHCDGFSAQGSSTFTPKFYHLFIYSLVNFQNETKNWKTVSGRMMSACFLFTPLKKKKNNSICYHPKFELCHLGKLVECSRAPSRCEILTVWILLDRKEPNVSIFSPFLFLEKKNAFNNTNVFSLVLSGKHMVTSAFLALGWLTVNSFNCTGSVVAFFYLT